MHAISLLSNQPWVERLGWTLIHFLWQGALIAAAYAIARRSRNAQVRYVLACVAMAAMMASPVITFTLTGASQPDSNNPYVGTVPVSSAVADAESVTSPSLPVFATRAAREEVMPWIVMAWFAGAMIFWLRLTGGWIAAARMSSKQVRPAPAEWQQKLNEIKMRIQISQPVTLLVSALVQVPTVIGWLRPVVLVPVGALAGLPPDHIEALLAHELAHIRRHDYLVNILQSIAEALLFYHPAVWWISNQIRNERELCCDDVAVVISGDVLIYAHALTELEANRPKHLNPALAANGGSLTDRIARLLGIAQPTSRILPGPGAATATASVLIVAAAYGLFAQPQEARPSFEVVSIKPNDLGGGHSHSQTSPGRLNASMTTKVLIEAAFGIKDFQISGGPVWLDQANYDFVAKTAAPIAMNRKSLQPYLQSLLTDRFHLEYHHATKEFPVYSLVHVKNGPHLTPHEGTAGERTDSQGGKDKISMTATDLSMAGFAGFLEDNLGRTVNDNTKLKGTFDLKLEWSPDQTGESSGPSIFTALQEQLGLKLESTKGPVEILVIDSIEKPSQN